MASGAYRQFDHCGAGILTHPADVTSTGTGDVHSLVAPPEAAGCFITVQTNSARVTINGDTPDTSHGIIIPKDSVPFFLPIGNPQTIKFASTVAGNSIVSICWVR